MQEFLRSLGSSLLFKLITPWLEWVNLTQYMYTEKSSPEQQGHVGRIGIEAPPCCVNSRSVMGQNMRSKL